MSRLSLAIPSKGRLKEKSEEWLAGAGFPVTQIGGERGYQAAIEGLGDVDMRLLSAREIAQGLVEGSLHAGITGEDLLHDLAPDGEADFRVVERLGFGGADVIVAVPQAWVDVDTMADLEAAGAAFRKAHHRRLRVATKYMRLTRRFFAARSVGEYRLVESAGATEAAPTTGTADVIVDITSTGATLRANGLKILSDGLILKSEAAVAISPHAAWNGPAKASLRTLLAGADITDRDILQNL
ncbi:MAG TPA: ATP phosphoribosyltransferase [Hyphomonas sp.]|nr:ATP phosphoribosyltransferase [Hyphomonas sp.]MCB9961035.1 ATP phosphoribosyltransferase [Hyphomonas sp.]MCB9970326.1 ATP phosphoribosyltransferase [Hyphomonas sp.]HPE48750.1 ATP phosphoribosyltransferase [Hyphomonas sp.]